MKTGSHDEEPSGSRLQKASWIALIASSLVGTSVTVAGTLVASPVMVATTIGILSLLLWLVLLGALVF